MYEIPDFSFNLFFLTFQGSGRGRGIGTVTAEDHRHQTDPTKRITREQEGKEGSMWSLEHVRLCASTHVRFYVCI